MQNNIFSHDHFNTWQTCKSRYFFKYIKKLNWPDFTGDYELGKNFHALIDYYLRGFDIEPLIKNAGNELEECWNYIKDRQILSNKLIKTEWGFNCRVSDTHNWLIGRIDAVFYDAKTDKYIIADWKTGKYIPKNINSNFQHKIYLYAFFNSKQSLNLDFEPEQLEFRYIKIQDGVSIESIDFSREKEIEYTDNMLNLIEDINKAEKANKPETCPINQCAYKNLCFKQVRKNP